MAGIMAETQRTRNPKIFITACCVIFWFSLGPASLFSLCPDDAGAAELKVLPSIAVSEEYTDNVFLTRYNKLDDYITRAIPAFTLDHKTAFWDWHLDLAYDYRYYAKGSKKDDSTYRVDLINHTVLINNFFFLDVLDKYERVSLTTTTDFTQQSLFVNQTDSNIFTVNPFFVMRNETRYTPILGYRYVNTWYKDSTQGISTVDNIGYAEMITALSSNVTFTIGARYTQDQNKIEDYNKTDVYAGPKYTYAPDSYVYCLIGESFLDFQTLNDTKHVIWDAGITHRYSTSTVSFQTKSDYIHDPELILRRVDFYVATIKKETPRTSYTILAGLYEFRNAATNHLEDDSYMLEGTLRHAISPTLTLLLEETVQRIEDKQDNTTISSGKAEESCSEDVRKSHPGAVIPVYEFLFSR
jgi:hypothetical protein